jgi:hypothetical protein
MTFAACSRASHQRPDLLDRRAGIAGSALENDGPAQRIVPARRVEKGAERLRGRRLSVQAQPTATIQRDKM